MLLLLHTETVAAARPHRFESHRCPRRYPHTFYLVNPRHACASLTLIPLPYYRIWESNLGAVWRAKFMWKRFSLSWVVRFTCDDAPKSDLNEGRKKKQFERIATKKCIGKKTFPLSPTTPFWSAHRYDMAIWKFEEIKSVRTVRLTMRVSFEYT